MKVTHLHGMSEASYNNWITNKGKDENNSPWSVSDRDGFTYLWSLADIIEQEQGDIDLAINNAFESALVQACKTNCQFVYVFGLDCSMLQPEEDTSCPGMDYCYRINESDLNNNNIVWIRQYRINKFKLPFIFKSMIEQESFQDFNTHPDIWEGYEVLKNHELIYMDDLFDIPETYVEVYRNDQAAD